MSEEDRKKIKRFVSSACESICIKQNIRDIEIEMSSVDKKIDEMYFMGDSMNHEINKICGMLDEKDTELGEWYIELNKLQKEEQCLCNSYITWQKGKDDTEMGFEKMLCMNTFLHLHRHRSPHQQQAYMDAKMYATLYIDDGMSMHMRIEDLKRKTKYVTDDMAVCENERNKLVGKLEEIVDEKKKLYRYRDMLFDQSDKLYKEKCELWKKDDELHNELFKFIWG
jgi:uncharacterized coiled-coil DUF342 family protein